MLGLRLDEPVELAGLEEHPRRSASSGGSSGSASRSADGDGLALTARGRFLGDAVTAALLA